MKIFKILLVIIACILMNACATTQVSTEFPNGAKVNGKEAIAIVAAENYGYYLFGCLPLFAGDPEYQNENTLTFFEDTVNLDNNLKMISNEAKKFDANTITAVNSNNAWTGSFSLWIVWRQTLITTSVITK